jgi:pimeloyl-ACP methyl ester carboxylesterase
LGLPLDEQGSGPTVVLLHAGVADRRMWREHLRPLADSGYRAIAPDLPGFGDAPAPAAPAAPWEDVLATLDELGVERFALAGSSFGGMVAQRVAAVAPERIESLFLCSSLAESVEPSERLMAAWEAEETALEGGDLEAAVAAVLDAWTLPDAPPELRDRLGEMQRRAFEVQAASHEVPDAPDPLEGDPAALSRVDAPAMIAVGQWDMSDFHDSAGVLAAALPRASVAVIEGAGHLAPLERPDAFRELLLEFLAVAAA